MWDKTFLLLLHSFEAVVATQCWQGATFSEAVVSPTVESSGILRVPGVASLPQCVAACCDLLGYDLAWLFEGRCYILNCQQRENCQLQERPGSDSVLAFLRRASPQTLVLQSLVRGEPYGGRWRPLSRSPEAPGALQDLPDADLLDVDYSDGSLEERGGPGLEVEMTDRPSLRGADRLNQSEVGNGPEGSMTQNSASWRNVSQVDEDETRRPTDPAAVEKTVSDEAQSKESSNPDSEMSDGSDAAFNQWKTQINTKTQNSADSTSLMQTPTVDSTHHDHMRMSLPELATPHWTISTSVQPDRPLMPSPGKPGESTTPEPDASVSPQTTAGMLKSSAGAPPTTTQPPARTMTSDLNTTTSAPSTIPPTTTNMTSTTAAAAESGSQVRGSNHGPVAVVGPDRNLFLPLTSILLDGSGSSDDRGIVRYHWDTVSGPPGLKLEGGDQVVATATGLRVGRYTFRLTVSDHEGATDSTSLTVRVQEARSLLPVAHAGGSHTLTLPNNSLILRGSVTDGDQTEVGYLWVRDHQSPASGDVLYGSDTQASLYLANLVEGTYLFQLRVIDAQGRSSTATATVEVQPELGGGEEVELEMQVSVSQVSVAQRDTVVRQLAALLHVPDSDIRVRALQGHSHLSTVLEFSVWGPSGPISGSRLVGLLRNLLLREKSDFLLFRVLRVDTVLCLLRCSGRGQCDPITKECTCDPFWTENLIRRYFGDGKSNCEWRLLYVILTSFTLMVFILSVSWSFICCCKRRRQMRVRKKTKYTILDNMDEQERVELRPKFSIKHRSTEHNSSLMMSESELDSDQDGIFSRDQPVISRNRLRAQAARNGNAFG